MFIAKRSPNTVVASSNETPWPLRFDAAFSGSHSKLYATPASYRRPNRSDNSIGITSALSRGAHAVTRADGSSAMLACVVTL